MPEEATEVKEVTRRRLWNDDTKFIQGPEASNVKRPKLQKIIAGFPESAPGLSLDEALDGIVTNFIGPDGKTTVKAHSFEDSPRKYVGGYLTRLLHADALRIA